MTVTSIGYDGTVNEAQWAELIPSAGSAEYGVVAPGDWAVTPHPSIAQAVNIAPGTGWGSGVMDTTDATITVQCDPISSGTRWDLIMMHRDWTPPGGTTAGAKINGTSTKQIPARSTNPGVTDDQPLALVQWTAGQTQPTATVDLRAWAGNGGMYAEDTLALSYLNRVGARVKIDTSLWSSEIDSGGHQIWVDEDGAGPWVNIAQANGWVNSIGRCRKQSRGSLLFVDLETKYTGSLTPASGWVIGVLPAGYKPANSMIVPGMQGTSTFNGQGLFFIGPNDIQMTGVASGKAFKIQQLVALQ